MNDGWKYSQVEAVPSDDLMRVRRRVCTRCDERIRSLDSELRASKAQHVLRGGRLRKQRARGKRVPKHVWLKRCIPTEDDQKNVRFVSFRSASFRGHSSLHLLLDIPPHHSSYTSKLSSAEPTYRRLSLSQIDFPRITPTHMVSAHAHSLSSQREVRIRANVRARNLILWPGGVARVPKVAQINLWPTLIYLSRLVYPTTSACGERQASALLRTGGSVYTVTTCNRRCCAVIETQGDACCGVLSD